MTFVIPPQDNRRHAQVNRNEISGTIWASKNITLDEEAFIKLSPATYAFTTTDDDADFTGVDAINSGDGEIFALGDEVFSGTVAEDAIADRSTDTNKPAPGTENDTVYFNGAQVVSDSATIKYESSTATWTTISGLSIPATAGLPTALAVFDGQNSLMVGRGNTVDLVSTSWTKGNTLTIPSEYQVTAMAANGATGYIATRHKGDGEAQLFTWDGNATSANASYGAGCYELSSLRVYGSSVVAVAANGRLLRFNGGGFDELARWPIYNTQYGFGNSNDDYANVANRGMVVDGERALVNVSSQLSHWKDYLTHFPSGAWCFDPSVGFYHRFSPTYTRISQDTIDTVDVNTATDEITVTSAPATGTPVLYSGEGGTYIGGLLENRMYYVINISSTVLKLAATPTDADAGTAIDLTGTGNSFQKLIFFPVYDYGHTLYPNRAAIGVLTDSQRDAMFSGRYVISATVNTDGSTEKTVLNGQNILLPNRGYFISPRLYSFDRHDKFTFVDFKHRPLKPGDEIIVKYKTEEDINYPLSIREYDQVGSPVYGTWTSTTTFTATHDLSNVSPGDEIEIIAGQGAGVLDHVASIEESGGTYTVTLEEGFAFATNGVQFRFTADNWTKLGSITSTSNHTGFRLDETSDFIQFKIELRGVDTTIIEMQVDNESYEKMV